MNLRQSLVFVALLGTGTLLPAQSSTAAGPSDPSQATPLTCVATTNDSGQQVLLCAAPQPNEGPGQETTTGGTSAPANSGTGVNAGSLPAQNLSPPPQPEEQGDPNAPQNVIEFSGGG